MTRTGLALGGACAWLAARPNLQCDPELLLNVVQEMVWVCKPYDLATCIAVGESAVKECALPVEIKHIWNGELIEPEDLQD